MSPIIAFVFPWRSGGWLGQVGAGGFGHGRPSVCSMPDTVRATVAVSADAVGWFARGKIGRHTIPTPGSFSDI